MMNGPSKTIRKILTLVLIRNCDQVLLGLKKRGFGAGRWNGFGGKVEPGETIQNAAKREVKEECNLTVKALDKIGLLTFEFVDEPEFLEVHVFTSNSFEGEIHESEEMKPQWYSISEIPYSQMWPDDRHWFPLFLEGKRFRGHFKFHGHDTILEHKIQTFGGDGDISDELQS